jgi:hypothetical protein
MPLTMSEKHAVANELRDRYRKASKKQKQILLDEFSCLTGYNRCYAARKLRSHRPRQEKKRPPPGRQGRKRFYLTDIIDPLSKIWAVMNFACGKRLAAGMPDLLGALCRHGELHCDPGVIDKLRRMSPATIDRLLTDKRKALSPHGRATTKPGSLLKSQIPIRMGSEWDDTRPGFVEMDLVAHCGDSTRGMYANTLDVTDIATGWSEQAAVVNKAQVHVFAAFQLLRSRFPFPLLGVDSDNGSEFINQEMLRYCIQENLVFTRSRPYKKNDGCHIEQKNWSIVRQIAGYGRFETQAETDLLNRIFELVRLHNNFFMPSVKLVGKVRDGAHVTKRYDPPLTPFKRVLASESVSQDAKMYLGRLFDGLNPLDLNRRISLLVSELYNLNNTLQR